jgi:hypothetical protein
MAMEPIIGPKIERKSGTGAPVEKGSYVTLAGARKTGNGAPTPVVPPQFRKFGPPK